MGIETSSYCVNCADNSEQEISGLPADMMAFIEDVASRRLCDIRGEYTDLFLQPEYSEFGDKVFDDRILDLRGSIIRTGNYVGVIGDGKGNEIRIRSRFDSSEEQPFLQYLLLKVLGARMVDLGAAKGKFEIFNLAEFLFPGALLSAVSKGLFKSYRTSVCNDANLKGRVDIPRHLRENTPFRGRISYSTRIKSADNDLTQLVRHAIEEIATSSRAGLLSASKEMADAVSLIRQATPSYDENVRSKVVAANLRPSRHPYYTEYDRLRRVCLKILLRHRISFGGKGDRAWGILFDVAWLWEEYVYRLLLRMGNGTLLHPDNLRRTGGLRFYADGKNIMFPDFLWASQVGAAGDQKWDAVLDTKYKRMSVGDSRSRWMIIQRGDRYQLLSYMHTTSASIGLLVYPRGDDGTDYIEDGEMEGSDRLRLVSGDGGMIGGVALCIPSGDVPFGQFAEAMRVSEAEFLLRVQGQLSPKEGKL